MATTTAAISSFDAVVEISTIIGEGGISSINSATELTDSLVQKSALTATYIDTSTGIGTYGLLAGSGTGPYTVSQAQYVAGSLRVYWKGQQQTQDGNGFTELDPGTGTFNLDFSVSTGLLVEYDTVSSNINVDTLTGGGTYGTMTGTGTGPYTVEEAVYTTGKLKVFWKGQAQTQDGSGFTENTPGSGTFDMDFDPAGDLLAEYDGQNIDTSAGGGSYGLLSGSGTGPYTVSAGAYVSGSLKVWWNGAIQSQDTGGFSETSPGSGTFTMDFDPGGGLMVEYE